MQVLKHASWSRRDGTLIHFQVSVDITVHGKVFAGHGATSGREGSGQDRVGDDSQDSVGQRA